MMLALKSLDIVVSTLTPPGDTHRNYSGHLFLTVRISVPR